MDLKLIKLKNHSGHAASVYTLFVEDENTTLYEKFIKGNISHIGELKDIVKRLNSIGRKTGARESFFKHKEGKPGDGVCALYDIPGSKLRLYCIRYGSTLIILGGGGLKPKNIKALQENDKLRKENYLLRSISKQITSRLINRDLQIISDGFDFEGDLNFTIDEEK